MLIVVILIVMVRNCRLLLLSIVIIKHFAQCSYADCCHTDCRGAQLNVGVAEYCYNKHFAQCCYADCCYTDCRGAQLSAAVAEYCYSKHFAQCCYAYCCHTACHSAQSNVVGVGVVVGVAVVADVAAALKHVQVLFFSSTAGSNFDWSVFAPFSEGVLFSRNGFSLFFRRNSNGTKLSLLWMLLLLLLPASCCEAA
jgi:hypothetical protein